MDIRNHSEFTETIEYLTLKNTLTLLGLDETELLGRFFNKLNDRGISSVYSTQNLTIMNSRLITAIFKTAQGFYGLKVFRKNNTDIFEISVVDLSTNETTHLFTLQSIPVD